MNKYMKKVLTLLAIATVLTACCKPHKELSEAMRSKGITFGSNIHSMRVANDLWEANDEIGVYMLPAGTAIDKASATNVCYVGKEAGATTTFAAKNSAETLMSPEDESKVDFIAYYPYMAAAPANGSIALDVNDQTMAKAMDILYANNAKAWDGTQAQPKLTFKHLMALLSLKFVDLNDQAIAATEITDLMVSGLVNSGSLSLADGTTTTSGAATDLTSIYGSGFTFLVIPQEVAANAFTYSFSYKGAKYHWTNIDKAITFVPGQTNAITIKVTPPSQPAGMRLSIIQTTCNR